VEEVIEQGLVKDMLGKVALDVVYERVDVFEDSREDEVSLAESVVVCGEPGILLRLDTVNRSRKAETDFEEE